MTDDNNNDKPEEGKITNLADFKANKDKAKEVVPEMVKYNAALEAQKTNNNPAKAEEKKPDLRTYFIELVDDEPVEIVGMVGLGGGMLMIGDGEGRILYAAADKVWKSCTDITEFLTETDDQEKD